MYGTRKRGTSCVGAASAAAGSEMELKDWLEVVANAASIITAVLAGWAWTYYQYSLHRKRVRIEEYLEDEKKKRIDKGQRTVNNIVAGVGIAEADVSQAVFSSKKINCIKDVDPTTKKTKGLFFEFKGDPR